MKGGTKKQAWRLLQSPEYVQEFIRLPSKHRGQVSRKTAELMSNPKPGGSRTPLKAYDALCRVRAGDFRIIYAYDDKVVQLLTLRRRDERTYDDLDELEIQQLKGLGLVAGVKASPSNLPDWDELARKWAQPTPRSVEELPQPITEAMLGKLAIPTEFREAATTGDDCGWSSGL